MIHDPQPPRRPLPGWYFYRLIFDIAIGFLFVVVVGAIFITVNNMAYPDRPLIFWSTTP